MEHVQPYTPEQAAAEAWKHFPPEVIQAANELISERLDQGRAQFTTQDLKDRIRIKFNKGSVWFEAQWTNNWLNIEEMYRQRGWYVQFDRPGHNEFYSASYIFSAKRK